MSPKDSATGSVRSQPMREVGVRLLRGLDVAGLDGVGEGLRLGQRLVGLRLHVRAVGGDGRVQPRVALGGLALPVAVTFWRMPSPFMPGLQAIS